MIARFMSFYKPGCYKMHLRIRLRAHLSVTQRKMHPGEGHLGSGDPRGRPNLD